MIKQIISTFVFIGTVNLAISQTQKIFTGTVDYKFNLSSTNTLKPSKRNNLENEINPYLTKINLLSSYYEAVNKGDTLASEKFLIGDSLLSKKDEFTLGYIFSLIRMKQLGILYKPSIQINDDSEENKIIVCNDQQQKEFIKHANSKKYKITCVYIGSLLVDNTQVYQLISYK